MTHGAGSVSSAGHGVGTGATNNKEAVLRKLLDTQDTYIHELESKCKSLTAQMLDSPF